MFPFLAASPYNRGQIAEEHDSQNMISSPRIYHLGGDYWRLHCSVWLTLTHLKPGPDMGTFLSLGLKLNQDRGQISREQLEINQPVNISITEGTYQNNTSEFSGLWFNPCLKFYLFSGKRGLQENTTKFGRFSPFGRT